MKTRIFFRIVVSAATAAFLVVGTHALPNIATRAAAGSRSVHIHADLEVTFSPPPVCSAGVCTIRNRGRGTMTPYGSVRFTTVITADGNQPPCGVGSQWVNRIVRTIKTDRGNLVLHEAGLQCPEPTVGPHVIAKWAVDGADSTGIFAGASGYGEDSAYPTKNEAAPQGTITLAT